jgi:transposase-like protein
MVLSLPNINEEALSKLNVKEVIALNDNLLGGNASYDDWRRQNAFVSWLIGQVHAKRKKSRKSVDGFPQTFKRSPRQIATCVRIGKLTIDRLREILSVEEVPSLEAIAALAPAEESPIKAVPEEKKAEAVAGLEQGKSIRKVAEETGLSKSTVENIKKEHETAKANPAPSIVPPPLPEDAHQGDTDDAEETADASEQPEATKDAGEEKDAPGAPERVKGTVGKKEQPKPTGEINPDPAKAEEQAKKEATRKEMKKAEKGEEVSGGSGGRWY